MSEIYRRATKQSWENTIVPHTIITKYKYKYIRTSQNASLSNQRNNQQEPAATRVVKKIQNIQRNDTEKKEYLTQQQQQQHIKQRNIKKLLRKHLKYSN